MIQRMAPRISRHCRQALPRRSIRASILVMIIMSHHDPQYSLQQTFMHAQL